LQAVLEAQPANIVAFCNDYFRGLVQRDRPASVYLRIYEPANRPSSAAAAAASSSTRARASPLPAVKSTPNTDSHAEPGLLVPTPPPGAARPSSGAGKNTTIPLHGDVGPAAPARASPFCVCRPSVLSHAAVFVVVLPASAAVMSVEFPDDLNRKRNRSRRISVSAEPIHLGDYTFPTYPKSDDAKATIVATMRRIFLFTNLTGSQEETLVDAAFERRVQPGEAVIKQGDDGDNFYMVDSGSFAVHVSSDPANLPGPKVGEITAGGSFGELALMYNTPRAATIVAETEGLLWALDRRSFQQILAEGASKKRTMYESFLNRVPILGSMSRYERVKLADALESEMYMPGDVIVRQGEPGEKFYIIENGTVSVTMTSTDDAGVEQTRELCTLGEGDYFGELALIENRPRAASVTAQSMVSCAVMSREAFERLLGSCRDIMTRHAAVDYDSTVQRVFHSNNH
jgi:cAMP-dependent protein kinase regulator